MGTRNLTCVVVDGVMKVAQYGQWDGYPSGNGIVILDFLTSNPDLSVMVESINNAVHPTPEDYKQWYVDAGQDPDDMSGLVTMDIAERFKGKHPSLSRDMGAGILDYLNNPPQPEVLEGEENTPFVFRPELALDVDFANDTLMCEWIYCVDIDNRKLEVYGGYDASPLPDENRFGPEAVAFIAKYDLDALPTPEEFLARLERAED